MPGSFMQLGFAPQVVRQIYANCAYIYFTASVNAQSGIAGV